MFGLLLGNPFREKSQAVSRILLQFCVVGLGFSMNLEEVLKVSQSGFIYTVLGISFVMSFGYLLGKFLKVGQTNSYLISVGTAICGGSAIAATGPVVNATDAEMSVSLGTVFILNSVALIIFPIIGSAAGLSQEQFGLWAALAIHDTSSVVGAGMKYGAVALGVATTVKLARALWIAPVALITSVLKKGETKIKYPYFILLFILASFVNTYFPVGQTVFGQISDFSKTGLMLTLFLIGSNISKETLKTVGVRPLLQGTILWIVVTALSLWLIYTNVIGV
jgi:uncharacterized integral membrane protein (TIGR00698 family)